MFFSQRLGNHARSAANGMLLFWDYTRRNALQSQRSIYTTYTQTMGSVTTTHGSGLFYDAAMKIKYPNVVKVNELLDQVNLPTQIPNAAPTVNERFRPFSMYS